MTASYLIGLREGLEATLVVSILVAFLVKSGQRAYLKLVWVGVAVALVLSVGVGALLEFTAANLTFEQREAFEAVTSIVAVCFVTFMIFWMRRMARRMAGELREQLAQAIRVGPFAVVVMAFLAVAREGLETAVLFFAAAQGTTASPFVAITLGVLTSVVLGWLLYASAVRINLTRFFTWTGALLVLVAAGILKYGVHDFQEAGILPGLNDLAYDVQATLPEDSWYMALLSGMFNITSKASVLESIAWIAYGVPVLVLFLWPRRTAPASPAPAPAGSAG